ncbi:uroporphyrinogen decarboxylase family protein [Candidatus Latescibacterota bacterium]
MKSNDRFYKCLHFQPVDHVVDMEFGYWNEIHELWQEEGLPQGLDTHEKLELYFGLERRYRPPINVLIQPEFEIEEISVRDGYRYYYDNDHVLCRVPVDSRTTMPEHLEYPLKSRQDWENSIKPKLYPDNPGRFPDNIVEQIGDALDKDYMPWLYVGSLFGRLRNFSGFENVCYMLYDAPDLVDEIIQHMADLTCTILERVMPYVRGRILVAHLWEDICFNAGPMISPEYFREHLVPRYKQITDILRTYGIDRVIVDCDGYIDPLITGWLEAGVNVMFPLERASGSDPVELRQKYGRDLLLMGGIDKRKIAKGGDEIVRELEYLAPLVEKGGYIPHCDHLCPADVTLEKYRYYLRKKRELFGIPLREERERIYPNDIT